MGLAIGKRNPNQLRNVVFSALEKPYLPSGIPRPHAKALAALVALSEWAEINVPDDLSHYPDFIRMLDAYRKQFTPELDATDTQISWAVASRLQALNAKNFAEADRIRAELLTRGVQLMDFKDPVTGERRTKWELKR